MSNTSTVTAAPADLQRALFPSGLGRLTNRSATDLHTEFHLDRGLPSLEFAGAVWDALVVLGSELPEHLRPLPPRPWQVASLQLLLEYSHASLQGARQGAGKTFVAALVVACHLLLGSSVTVAMPTYRQTEGILVRRALLFMELLAPHLGLTRLTCNRHEATWSNGARLMTLSTSTGGRRGTQGWTSRVVLIDESQDVKWRDLAWFMPLVAIAMKQRCGRFLLVGVGASDLAAPSQARQMPEYASLVLDDATISEIDRIWRAQLPPGSAELDEDSWAQFFSHERAICEEDFYRQFYMCQPPGSGQRKVFERVPEMVGVDTLGAADGTSAYGPESGVMSLESGLAQRQDPRLTTQDSGLSSLAGYSLQGRHISGPAARCSDTKYILGVDVGKQRDQTVVAVLEQVGQSCNLIDCVRLPLGMAYTEQAQQLAALARQWGCPPGPFAVEVNGPGQALYDVLVDPAHPPIWHALPVMMTPQRKLATVTRLNADMRHGLFGVAEIPLRGSRVVDSSPVGTGPALSAVWTRPAASVAGYIADSAGAVQTADAAGGVPTRHSHYRGPTIRQHLANLSLFSTADGVLTWEHSDILSALIVARAALDDARSV
jgi:hypothetical protein